MSDWDVVPVPRWNIQLGIIRTIQISIIEALSCLKILQVLSKVEDIRIV